MSRSDPAADREACPACGARLGGRAGCQAAFDDLVARAWTSPAHGAMHQLVVDAYCLQHPEDYCRSAKSYAAHLAGLCCGLEAAGDAQRYWAIARWLDGARELTKPSVLAPAARGAITVADAAAGADDAAYAASVRAWARAVWAAYGSQHEVARGWLLAATAASGRGGASTARR